jgi:transcriptional regulator with XRE-family HTH domain
MNTQAPVRSFEVDLDWELVARSLLRRVRAHRSQVAWSRRLGYRGNPIADWEAGRRFPTAGELLRACRRGGLDVHEALRGFAPEAIRALGEADDAGVAAWLDALRGDRQIRDVAEMAGRSRYAVGRWLSGTTRPRVPDFLRLVQALNGRALELADVLAPATAATPASAPERSAAAP